MSKTKTTRGMWENNNSIIDGSYSIMAAFIAHSLDNSAIVQNRRYTKATAEEVTKRLSETFKDVEFNISSVKGVIDGIATNKALRPRWKMAYEKTELPLIRKMILGK